MDAKWHAEEVNSHWQWKGGRQSVTMLRLNRRPDNCYSLPSSGVHQPETGSCPRDWVLWPLQCKIIVLLLLLHQLNGLFSRTTWISRYQKSKTSLDLNEARDYGVWGWQWHQLDHMQTICTSLQTDNHTNNTSSLNFYRLDVLPDAQPTVSKLWRQNV